MKIFRFFITIALIFMEFGCSSTKSIILMESLSSDNPKIKNVMLKQCFLRLFLFKLSYQMAILEI